ncbi:MAG: heat-inducible transcription repressor HrcA [Deltaproteobacteria bacterium]|nr:heat-inducible transcription repressor HrcA [Deltaproteobacteria bacterium]
MELNARARKILYAAVTEFISTGEPVGSRTLARKYDIDLSPASIRNVLSDLEEEGYFHQPHASAGRVPTDRAFRFFIDGLMQLREINEGERVAIERRFREIEPDENPLRETARLLSKLTGTAAVVVAPRIENQVLKQLRFIPTRPGEMLAVVVTASGNVENRFVRVESHPPNEELERIHNLLDDVLEGRSLREVRELFARRLQDARNEIGVLRRRAFELGDAALRSGPGQVDVVIEGQAQLLDKPEFADVDRIKALVRVLEERERLVAFLDRTIETRGVQIVLPGEEEEALGEVSLIGTRYSVDEARVQGTVGVIGPKRMDYAAIVPLVHETAQGLGKYLAKKNRDSDE